MFLVSSRRSQARKAMYLEPPIREASMATSRFPVPTASVNRYQLNVVLFLEPTI